MAKKKGLKKQPLLKYFYLQGNGKAFDDWILYRTSFINNHSYPTHDVNIIVILAMSIYSTKENQNIFH